MLRGLLYGAERARKALRGLSMSVGRVTVKDCELYWRVLRGVTGIC